MKVVTLSSHLDDAIFSAGQFLASQEVCSITLFAGTPENSKVLTSYDAKYNFQDAADAMHTRRNEDIQAHAFLSINPIHLEYTDAQYGEYRDREKIRTKLQIIIEKENPDLILGPLGVGHPDHRFTSEISIELAGHLNIPLRLYEDTPGKIIDPDEVYRRKQELADLGYKLDYDAYPDYPLTPKVQAIMCYKSQLGGYLNLNILCCPERFWNVWRINE